MAELIKPNNKMGKGYFGIGIENFKTEQNIGTLIRSAKQFGASFIFIIGNRYKKQPSAVKLESKIPIFYFETLSSFKVSMPEIEIIGIELTDKSINLFEFKHPKNCVYLLGSEDKGLSKEALELCDRFIIIEGNYSLNVSVAGSIVMYNRLVGNTTLASDGDNEK